MVLGDDGRFVLIGTVQGHGFNCKKNDVAYVDGVDDGIWNKVSYHTRWIIQLAKQLNETLCVD